MIRSKQILRLGLVILILAALALGAGTALAASEGGHGETAAPAHGEAAPAHGEAAAEHGGGHGHAITDGQVWDFIYRVINFAVLVVILVVVLKRPLGTALRNRTEDIQEELSDLEARREEAKRQYALMEERLKDSAAERETILASYREQGEREKEKIIESATTLAERIKGQAQMTIEQETASAKAELRREVAEMSSKVAEDLLRSNINAEDQSRLVSEYLAKVEQQEVQ